eukprot:NODE_167_length_14562_cov_0.357256.p16 type:complete len:102 gc:universal NODE_167_length_14562_cov_0.357256:9910-9605(-)
MVFVEYKTMEGIVYMDEFAASMATAERDLTIKAIVNLAIVHPELVFRQMTGLVGGRITTNIVLQIVTVALMVFATILFSFCVTIITAAVRFDNNAKIVNNK